MQAEKILASTPLTATELSIPFPSFAEDQKKWDNLVATIEAYNLEPARLLAQQEILGRRLQKIYHKKLKPAEIQRIIHSATLTLQERTVLKHDFKLENFLSNKNEHSTRPAIDAFTHRLVTQQPDYPNTPRGQSEVQVFSPLQQGNVLQQRFFADYQKNPLRPVYCSMVPADTRIEPSTFAKDNQQINPYGLSFVLLAKKMFSKAIIFHGNQHNKAVYGQQLSHPCTINSLVYLLNELPDHALKNLIDIWSEFGNSFQYFDYFSSQIIAWLPEIPFSKEWIDSVHINLKDLKPVNDNKLQGTIDLPACRLIDIAKQTTGMGLQINDSIKPPCISLYGRFKDHLNRNETTAALALLETWPVLGKMGIHQDENQKLILQSTTTEQRAKWIHHIMQLKWRRIEVFGYCKSNIKDFLGSEFNHYALIYLQECLEQDIPTSSSRGLSAGSREPPRRFLDPADKPRDDGLRVKRKAESSLTHCNAKKPRLESSDHKTSHNIKYYQNLLSQAFTDKIHRIMSFVYYENNLLEKITKISLEKIKNYQISYEWYDEVYIRINIIPDSKQVDDLNRLKDLLAKSLISSCYLKGLSIVERDNKYLQIDIPIYALLKSFDYKDGLIRLYSQYYYHLTPEDSYHKNLLEIILAGGNYDDFFLVTKEISKKSLPLLSLLELAHQYHIINAIWKNVFKLNENPDQDIHFMAIILQTLLDCDEQYLISNPKLQQTLLEHTDTQFLMSLQLFQKIFNLIKPWLINSEQLDYIFVGLKNIIKDKNILPDPEYQVYLNVFLQIDLALKRPLITQSRIAMMYLFLISCINRLYFKFILSSVLTSSAILTTKQQLDASISKLLLNCGYKLSHSEIRMAWLNLKKMF